MGKVLTRAQLTNNDDLVLVRAGVKRPAEVRSLEVEALVDTAATMLVLPQDLVDKLGLLSEGEVTVTYANGAKEKRTIAGGVRVSILGREALGRCIVEKAGSQVLVGQLQLEEMDLVVDPKKGILGPRPESPDMPLIEIL